MNKGLKQRGIGLIEVIVGSAILSLVLFAFTSSLSLYSAASVDATKRTQALFLAEEGLEVVRALRDESWEDNIATKETGELYGLSFDSASSTWATGVIIEEVEGFTRTLTFEDVYRDEEDDITDGTSGSYDPDTRRAIVEVSWQSRRGEQSIVLESLVANAFTQ